jgi:hypothetical protein
VWLKHVARIVGCAAPAPRHVGRRSGDVDDYDGEVVVQGLAGVGAPSAHVVQQRVGECLGGTGVVSASFAFTRSSP